MVEIHEDDLFCVVLYAEFSLYIVHDVVDSIKFSCFDLLISEVYFETPKDKTLFLFLGLFKEDVDYVFDRRRDGQKFFFTVNWIVFLELFLD